MNQINSFFIYIYFLFRHKKDPEFSLWKRKIDVVIPKSESNFDPETLCPQTASQNNESSGLSNGSANGLHPLADALVDSSCMNGNEPAELSSGKANDTNHKSVDEIEDGAPSEDNVRNDEVDLANDSGLQTTENLDLPGTNENHRQVCYVTVQQSWFSCSSIIIPTKPSAAIHWENNICIRILET